MTNRPTPEPHPTALLAAALHPTAPPATELHPTDTTCTGHSSRPPLQAALRQQLNAALRNGLRPASYLGLVREALLTSVHAATYPLGLLPAPPLRLDAPDPDTLTPAARRPVMLVHGWVHNRTAFLLMQRGLRRAGLGPLHTFEYPSFTGDLHEVAHRLVPAVERLVRSAGRERCVLIGHSMGGLIARQYVQELGGHHLVDTVVTMGTPHRGTFSAYCGLGRPAQQCRPGSPYLRRLERTAAPSNTKWISYYSDLDFMVMPAVSAKLTHPALDATNVRVRDVGHLSMLLSPSLLNDLVHRLNARHAGEPPSAAAG